MGLTNMDVDKLPVVNWRGERTKGELPLVKHRYTLQKKLSYG